MLAGAYQRILLFLWIIACVFPIDVHAISIKSYSYDKYGNLQAITDPRGFVTQYRYDLLNRLETIEYPDKQKVQYSYDLSGVRTKMEDHRGTTLFEPDEFGRITKVTFPGGQSVFYQYDSESNLIKLIYPDGIAVEYTYDLSNRLESVKDHSGVTTFEYDELSNTLQKRTLPNGVTTEYRYHSTRKISNVIHKQGDGKLIEEFRYAYDERGNRTRIERISPSENSYVVYAYDKLNRVLRAQYSNGFFEAFSYDGAGNRRSKTTPQGTILYEYDGENRLTTAGDITYSYDFAGNVIKKSSPHHMATYTYDVDNRLISYSDESNQVVFEYDGDGNRISKTVNGVRTDYINDLVAPVSQVLLKRVQGNWLNGEKTIHYMYGGSRISQSAENQTQFYLSDSMGRNISALVNASGEAVNHYAYGAFGNVIEDEHSVPNVYKYCGEQFDEETGLIFLRNRYYDPDLGRFISKDPRPGRLNRPSTFNPYCYVENNPINFIDPQGYEAIAPEEWEWVIVHINARSGWFGGQGIGGHAFMEFPARKESVNPYFGNYPGDYHVDEVAHINANTFSVAALCRKDLVGMGIEVMKGIEWTTRKNCVFTVVEGMKIMEFPHAEKIQLSIIPAPFELKSQMSKFFRQDRNEASNEPLPMQSPSETLDPLGMNVSPSLDFGGVSLSKTAELQLSLADITGAALDAATGQIILFGPQDRYLPPIDLDDLAVAVRSVYGIGALPQDPGISIDPDIPGQMKVRYDGATADTAFGQTIFEADYLLKCLAVGKNKETGQPFHLNIPGYASLLGRLSAYQWRGGQLDLIRFWFIPDQITLVETDDHKGMVFSDVRMKVMTEALLKGLPTDHPASREFAEYFTAHYDEFARQLPVLEQLKGLGKITAIVKWLRENNVPFDTSFFANYQPKRVETPHHVSPIESAYQWTSTHIEKRHVPGHKHPKDVEVTDTYTIPISGGVIYKLNSQNYATSTHPIANEFASSAIQSRPSENDFSWSFISPKTRETFMAVAQSVYRTKKPGNVKKSYIDMSVSVPGSQSLALQRFYNSFSERESPFGRGWRVLPYELELPAEKIRMATQDGRECISHRMILVRTPEGEDFYQLCMLNDNNLPILKSPVDASFLQDNLNGTFTLIVPQVGRRDFDSQGRLIQMLDTNGCAVEYQFDDRHLSAIRHQNGSVIRLEYDSDRVVQASGPGNNAVQYAYHDNGQLADIGDKKQTHLHYSYDSDKRLNQITDHLGNVLFEAKYDEYNRAIAMTEGALCCQSNFSLERKSMKVTDGQGNESTFQFDGEDRLIYKKDPLGLVWEFAYEQGECRCPTKIKDPKGGVAECRYDPFGHPIYFKNAVGAEWRFFFDNNGNLAGQREPNGRATWNLYDGKNHLSQSFLKAAIDVDENDHCARGYRKLTFSGQYTNSFSYDPHTGELISRTNTRQGKTSFTYDKNGQNKEILCPTGYRIERTVDEMGKILNISDGFGIQKSFDYDESNRVKAIRTPAGTTQFTYDEGGYLKLIVDMGGCATAYRYDGEHNLTEVIDAESAVSSYGYNALGQLTHLSLPNGSCKTIEYDSFGRLQREIFGK
jgi:RHS repeat-associated protein